MFNREMMLMQNSSKKSNRSNSDFLNYSANDLLERLDLIKIEHLKKVSLIRNYHEPLESALKSKFKDIEIVHIHDEIKDLANLNNIDLIIFPFGLHWCADVNNFFKLASNALGKDGMILANFAANGSLYSLKNTFIEIEQSLGLPSAPHIVPMISFDDVAGILSSCGFKENIADLQKLELEFDNAYLLMQFLKSIAENNFLDFKYPYRINRQIYNEIKLRTNSKINTFVDKINLCSFIATKNKNTILMR